MRSEVAARLPRSLEEERKKPGLLPSHGEGNAERIPEHSRAMTKKPRSFLSFDLPVILCASPRSRNARNPRETLGKRAWPGGQLKVTFNCGN
jgi:hypothetical protein